MATVSYFPSQNSPEICCRGFPSSPQGLQSVSGSKNKRELMIIVHLNASITVALMNENCCKGVLFEVPFGQMRSDESAVWLNMKCWAKDDPAAGVPHVRQNNVIVTKWAAATPEEDCHLLTPKVKRQKGQAEVGVGRVEVSQLVFITNVCPLDKESKLLFIVFFFWLIRLK